MSTTDATTAPPAALSKTERELTVELLEAAHAALIDQRICEVDFPVHKLAGALAVHMDWTATCLREGYTIDPEPGGHIAALVDTLAAEASAASEGRR